MAEIITGQEIRQALTPNVGGVSSAIPQGDMTALINDLKGFKELADTIDSILSKIVQMKQSRQPQENKDFTGGGGFQNQAPTQVPISSNTQVMYINKEISEEKLKVFLYDLIVNQAPAKLPKDIQEMKINDILGRNFVDFSYMYKGVIPVKSDILLNTIVSELAKAINKIIKEQP